MSRHVYEGTTEYLTATLTATVTLDAQPVAFSFDGVTYTSASWVGAAAKRRKAQILLNAGNWPGAGTRTVYVKVTDSPEIPVINVGQVTFHDL